MPAKTGKVQFLNPRSTPVKMNWTWIRSTTWRLRKLALSGDDNLYFRASLIRL